MIRFILGFALGWVSGDIAKSFASPLSMKWWAIAVGLGLFGNVLAQAIAAMVRA